MRLPGSTDLGTEAAINNAEVIRTHLLRPTWHFVTAEDVYWLLDLTAPQTKAAQSSRDRDLELTEPVFTKSNSIIEKALSGGRHLARVELIAELQKGGIATNQNRASHLFARVELDKIICSGAIRNGKPTYALLSERVEKNRELTKEEALAKLARCYFTSHCPATLQDFTWWSGLPAREANQALELVKSNFIPETIGMHTYWFNDQFDISKTSQACLFLLPTYDEYILSYSDRSASIPANLEHHMKLISDRGIFRPIIVIDGQVMGIWKRTIKKDIIIVELLPFTNFDRSTLDLVDKVAYQYGGFLGKKIEVRQVNQ